MKLYAKINIHIPTILALALLLLTSGVVSYRILAFYGPKKAYSQTYTIASPSAGLYRELPENRSSSYILPPIRMSEKEYKVPVLMYHYVSVSPDPGDTIRIGLSTSPYVFDTQMKELGEAGYETITFDDLFDVMAGKIELPKKPVILTFDDGYEDFYTYAYPILTKYQKKGINFIPTGLIDRKNYLTWKQIEEMNTSPYISFGAHTIHHYSLPSVKASVYIEEITESKKTLESHLGHEIHWFAYPYGAFDARVVKAVQHAGYYGATTTLPGSKQYESRLFYVPRYRAGNRTGSSFLKLLE